MMHPERVIESSSFFAAAAAAVRAAMACRRARQDGRGGGDSPAWWLVAGVFVAFASTRLANVGMHLGVAMRRVARAYGFYGGRRPYQIAATIVLAVFAIVVFTVAVRSYWDLMKRYRLAVACACVVLASALIRFVSLHEVDAWNNTYPWVRVTVDVGTATLATAIALARVRQLASLGSGLQPDQ